MNIELIQAQWIDIGLIDYNEGQVEGLPANPRTIDPIDFANLKKSIEEDPEMLGMRELLVYPLGGRFVAIGGNMRLKALREMHYNAAPCKVLAQDTPQGKLRAIAIKDNVQKGEWDAAMLANDWSAEELQDWGVDLPEFEEPEETKDNNNERTGTLTENFIIPPYSIFDTRQGYWQTRKKQWREMIGDYGESRSETLISSSQLCYKDLYTRTMKHRKELGVSFDEYIQKYVSKEELEQESQKKLAAGVSVLDPVMAEVVCKWFGFDNCNTFDCFAGDSVFGWISAYLGNNFTGIELRPEQAELNNERVKGMNAHYICDDGQNVAKHIAPESQDLLFSCPPYFDLEVYSDLPNDASNQGTYEDFIQILRNAFTAAVGCLKNNRFAVICVGDVRNKKSGFYYDFVGDIKNIFRDAGMNLYNEIILVEMASNAFLRAGKMMESRKVVKTHQNVLVFYKGNAAEIKNNYKKIEYASKDLESFIVDNGNEPTGFEENI